MTLRLLQSPGLTTEKDPELDLDDTETNFMSLMKLRGDLSGKDFFFAFPGQAWVMVPQEQNYKCFRTFGFGSGRLEKVAEGYRIYSRGPYPERPGQRRLRPLGSGASGAAVPLRELRRHGGLPVELLHPASGGDEPQGLMDGPRELPRTILDYVEKHHSEYLAAPTVWNGPQMTSSAQVFKGIIDKRRAGQ